ncbi:MAG: DMT family transporter [Clostridiales bacterium]|nr:DMT family transporter [Clostridiales bacterium]
MNKITLYALIFVMGIITANINAANGIFATKVGLLESVLTIHLIGLTMSSIYFLFLEKNKKRSALALIKTKPYLLLGGFIGSFAVVSISFAVQNIGVLLVSTALIAGQFIFSFVIDMNGWFGFDKLELTKSKVASIIIMITGVALLSI